MQRHHTRILARASCVLAALILLGFGRRVDAQLATATLSGVVSDPSGAGIPAAEVTLRSTLEQASRQTLTDSTGTYVIPAILPGTYELVIKAGGFESQTLTNIV